MHKKKHHHEEHEEHVNHEAWVIPYADMLTLLMAMFLVLWAIGQVDVSKAKAVSTGFADQFGLTLSAGSGAGGVGVMDGSALPEQPNPADVKEKVDKTMAIAEQKRRDEAQATERQSMTEVEREIARGAEAAGLAGSVQFRMEGRGLIVSIVAEGVLFDPGSASIKPPGTVILDGIAATLANLPNDLSIEGHTDSIPIATAQFPSNWELSTARASAVLRYLQGGHGLPQNRLSAAGYADQRPVASNDTAGGRAQNRRVDLAVIAEYPSTDLPGGTSTLGEKAALAAAETPATEEPDHAAEPAADHHGG